MNFGNHNMPMVPPPLPPSAVAFGSGSGFMPGLGSAMPSMFSPPNEASITFPSAPVPAPQVFPGSVAKASFNMLPTSSMMPPSIPSSNGEAMAMAIEEDQPTNPPIIDNDPMPEYQQFGELTIGPGARRELPLMGLGLTPLTSRITDDIARAKKYSMEQSIKVVLMKQTMQHQQQQQKVAMYAQALSLMSRVYIGSISFELKEDAIRSAFSPFGPIKSINMSYDAATGKHMGYAFMEYETPEAAELSAQQMHGVFMGSRNLKVGRPSNMPQAQPIIDQIMDEARGYNRIYIASVHPDLSEEDLRSVFEAFGIIKACELAKIGPNTMKHKGFGYIEYNNQQACTDAVSSMNLFDLGGQHLRVGKAVTPPQTHLGVTSNPSTAAALPTAAAVAAAAVTAKIQAIEATGPTNRPNALSAAPKIVVQGQASSNELTMQQGGAVFTVPPPGIAIPQLPVSAVATPPPQIVTPQLYSTPPTSSSSTPPVGVTVTGPIIPDLTSAALQLQQQETSAPVLSKTAIKRAKANVKAEATGIAPKKRKDKDALLAITAGETSDSSKALVAVGKAREEKKKPRRKSRKKVKDEPIIQMTKEHYNLAADQLRSSEITTEKLLANPNLSEKQKQLIETEAGQSLAQQEDVKIKGNEARNILMHKLMRKVESNVIVLKNMVTSEGVDDYLEQDVTDECSKFGQVEKVVVFQQKHGTEPDAPTFVKIFVQFSLATEAETAKNSLDNRFFDGRSIKAEVYDQSLWEDNELAG